MKPKILFNLSVLSFSAGIRHCYHLSINSANNSLCLYSVLSLKKKSSNVSIKPEMYVHFCSELKISL